MRFVSCLLWLWLSSLSRWCVCGVDVSHSHSHALTAFDRTVADVSSRLDRLNRDRVNSLVEENGYELLEILGGAQHQKNGQVGLEIELHLPRIVMYSRYKGERALKSVPQFYGDTWATSANGVWYITTDNEDNHIGEMEKQDPLRKSYLTLWSKLVNEKGDPIKGAARLLDDTCGLNTAMEFVTKPIDTDSPKAHLLIQMALRSFVKVLKSFRAGEHLGLDPDGKKKVEYEKCKPLAVAVPGADGSTHYCVLFEQVRVEFNKELDRLAKTTKQLQHIIDYKLLPEAIPWTVYDHTKPFKERKTRPGLLPKYQVYMVFHKSDPFKYAAQINFGYPIANFANGVNDKKFLHKHVASMGSWNKLVGGQPQTRSSRFKFTNYVLPGIIGWGRVIGDYACPEQSCKPEIQEDVRGLMAASLYFYFHYAYMGAVSKGAQNILIKTPLNEVVRALPSNAKKAIALFVTEFKLDDIGRLFENMSKEIYKTAKLEEKRYFPIALGTEDELKAFKAGIIKGIFDFQPGYEPYVGETTTSYGKFDPLKSTDKQIVMVVAHPSPTHPFEIKGRVSVLLESRPVYFPFNKAWGDLDTYGEFDDDNFKQIKQKIDTNLKTMEELQTTLIERQQQQQQHDQHVIISTIDDDDGAPNFKTEDYSADEIAKWTKFVGEMYLQSKTKTKVNPLNTVFGDSNSEIAIKRQESNNGIDPNDETEPKDKSPPPQFKTFEQLLPLFQDMVKQAKQTRKQIIQAKKK